MSANENETAVATEALSELYEVRQYLIDHGVLDMFLDEATFRIYARMNLELINMNTELLSLRSDSEHDPRLADSVKKYGEAPIQSFIAAAFKVDTNWELEGVDGFGRLPGCDLTKPQPCIILVGLSSREEATQIGLELNSTAVTLNEMDILRLLRDRKASPAQLKDHAGISDTTMDRLQTVACYDVLYNLVEKKIIAPHRAAKYKPGLQKMELRSTTENTLNYFYNLCVSKAEKQKQQNARSTQKKNPLSKRMAKPAEYAKELPFDEYAENIAELADSIDTGAQVDISRCTTTIDEVVVFRFTDAEASSEDSRFGDRVDTMLHTKGWSKQPFFLNMTKEWSKWSCIDFEEIISDWGKMGEIIRANFYKHFPPDQPEVDNPPETDVFPIVPAVKRQSLDMDVDSSE